MLGCIITPESYCEQLIGVVDKINKGRRRFEPSRERTQGRETPPSKINKAKFIRDKFEAILTEIEMIKCTAMANYRNIV